MSLPQPEDPPGSFLFSDEEIAELTDEERRYGRYTLARLPAAKEQSCLVLLRERRPLRDIARLLSMAFETVQAVAMKHAKELDEHYKDLPRNMRRATYYAVDRLERNMDSIPAHLLPQTIKQLSDVWLLLEGQATSRVEHVGEVRIVNSLEEYERLIAPIEKRIAGRMIEGGEEMHLGGEKKPAPAPPPALPGAPGTSPATSPAVSDLDPTRDWQSDVSCASAQANGSPATPCDYTLDPESTQNQAQDGPPRGGVEPAAGQAPTWKHQDS
jgi:hypothetical protein